MSKKFLITENERLEIRKMYSLDEGWVTDLLSKISTIGKPVLDYITTELGLDTKNLDSDKLEDKLKNASEDKKEKIKNKLDSESSVKSPGSGSVSYKKLFNDLNSKLKYPELSAGLVSNAKFESGFEYTAMGDGGNYAKNKSQAITVNGKKYCSFGLFQLNICGGLGNDFLKYYNIQNSSKSKQLDYLTDYDNQIEFMSYYLKSRKSPPKGKSAEELSKWFTKNVEIPSDAENKANKRASWLKGKLSDFNLKS
jgi:hypothetical protein